MNDEPKFRNAIVMFDNAGYVDVHEDNSIAGVLTCTYPMTREAWNTVTDTISLQYVNQDMDSEEGYWQTLEDYLAANYPMLRYESFGGVLYI